MGSLKLEQRQKVEQDQERGNEIKELGDQKIQEAETSAAALESIEGVDDDDRSAVESARSEADGIAKEIAETEIKAPGAEVGESLKETSEQANEYAETEDSDAEKAAEMTGDYEGTGSNLEGQLEQSGEEFREISEQSDQVNEELQASYEQQAAALGGTFG